jgi:hypothetical protein
MGKKLNKLKKAEMTTQQIVLLVILLVSFIVVMYFIFFLNPGEVTDSQICHTSVLNKEKTIGVTGSVDCKTNYVCISSGGSCGDFKATTTKSVELSGGDQQKRDAVMNAVAEEMVDCWWMFGEGKINYGTNLGYSLKCARCSVVSFDDGIQREFLSTPLSYKELYYYLERAKKDDSQTYLNYLYGVSSFDFVKIPTEFKLDLNNENINVKEQYSIMTGIDDNIAGSDKIMRVVIIPSKETSSRISCGGYITRV